MVEKDTKCAPSDMHLVKDEKEIRKESTLQGKVLRVLRVTISLSLERHLRRKGRVLMMAASSARSLVIRRRIVKILKHGSFLRVKTIF